MSDVPYSSSPIWQSLHAPAEIASVVGPVLLVVGTALWLYRVRSPSAFVAFAGGVLVAVAELVHHMVPSVESVGLPYPQPTYEQNGLVLFLYLYGLWFGYVLLGAALVLHFARSRHAV
jgi:hypothetical protein